MSSRSNCNLWRIWYSLLMFSAYTYLFYKAVFRYTTFRKLTLNNSWPQGVLNFYLTTITISMAMLPINIYSILFKTENYANDGAIFEKNYREANIQKSSVFKRHFQPYFAFIHVISAYFLLIPIPILIATQILHGKYSKNYVWFSDMNFLFPRHDFGSNYSDYKMKENVDLLSVTPEFVNYVASLIILMGNYPSSFWHTNRSYSITFSFLVFLGNLHLVFDFCATSIYYKFALNMDLVGKTLLVANISPIWILIIGTASIFLVLLLNVALFQYGFSQYLLNLKVTDNYTAIINDAIIRERAQKRICSNSYLPQIVGLLLLAVIICCKIPILLDYMTLHKLYKGGLSSVMLVSLLITAAYIFSFTVSWVIFSLKTRRWKFSNFEQLNSDHIYDMHNGKFVHTNSTMCSATTDTCSQLSSSLNSRHTNNYVYVSSPLSNIPTISENVDCNSVYSYESHTSRALSLPNSRKIMCSSNSLPHTFDSPRNTIAQRMPSQHSSSNTKLLPKQQLLMTASLQRYSRFKGCNKVTFENNIHGTHPEPSFAPDFAISANNFKEQHYHKQGNFATYPYMTQEDGAICYPEPEYLHVPDILMSEVCKSDSSLNKDKNELNQLLKEDGLIDLVGEKMCSEV